MLPHDGMHFGRMTSPPAGTDLTLPADPLRTRRFLALGHGHETRLICGCPVWSSKEWIGDVYPTGTPARAMLYEYSRRFDTVELNSTFYQLLGPERLAAWAADTPAGFTFCPKVFRGITERLAAPDLSAVVAQFCKGIAGLGDRVGICFATPPESFAPADLPLLARLFTVWPRHLPLSVELRHPGWFTPDHALIDPAIDLFWRHGVATVVTDTLGRRDALHLSLTQPRLLIRFLGADDPSGDARRIAHWGVKLASWGSAGLETVFIIAHQPANASIPATVRAFRAAVHQTASPRGMQAPLFP